jgi:hypothetical protein
MAASIGGSGTRTGQKFAALEGVPLRWREQETGRVTEMRVDAKAGIEDTAFEIPAGYSEQHIEIPRGRPAS